MNVFCLPSDQINENWSWISSFLDRVKSDWKPLDVRRALMKREAQLWAMEDGKPRAIWITKLEADTGLLWIAAGSPLLTGLEFFREHTEPWFRAKGCKRVRIIGRKGWKKVLPDYEEVGIVLEKSL